MTSNRSKSIQELKNVTTCSRCVGLGHWEDECFQKGHRWRLSPSGRSSGRGRFRKKKDLKKRHRKAKARAEARDGGFSLKRPLQLRKCRGDAEERTFHIIVPAGWAVLDCDEAKSLAGAEPAAMLAQACQRRGRAVEEKYLFRGFGDQVITFVPGGL